MEEREMDMGLSPQEVAELIQYIQENNSWRDMYTLHKKGRKTPKYYTMQFDSRTGDMWAITFSSIVGGGYNSKKEVFFRTENGYSLKDRIYKWLDEECVK